MQNNKPTLVRFLNKNGDNFDIEVPILKNPLVVSRFYYERMLNSPDKFQFIN